MSLKRSKDDENQQFDEERPAKYQRVEGNVIIDVEHNNGTSENNEIVGCKGNDIHKASERSFSCPYLDTIQRKFLDFDFEKQCSVTLSHVNVYVCLVCGKYFQGRGINTPAYTHSLHDDHHVFLNLKTSKAYCLPDNYEVIDPTLDDIIYNLNPTYSDEQIENLDKKQKIIRVSKALNGETYIPGYIGLNNIKYTDGVNVIIQSLAKIVPLRNYFIKLNEIGDSDMSLQYMKLSPVLITFSELMRKIWNPKNFKNHVSPHEFMQSVSVASEKRFRIGKPTDPAAFLMWFLNHCHTQLMNAKLILPGSKKNNEQTIISKVFQGRVTVTTEIVETKDGDEEMEHEAKTLKVNPPKKQTIPFLCLTLDPPANPLFVDDQEKNIIPQVSLLTILNKFDGKTETTRPLKSGSIEKKTYKLESLPPYLVFHIKRFSSNFFVNEKNRTIVNFPVKNLDLSDYLHPNVQNQKNPHNYFKYNLVSNIVHEGKPGEGSFKVHIPNKMNDKWHCMQDLDVKDIMPQEVSISESYLQFWERHQ